MGLGAFMLHEGHTGLEAATQFYDIPQVKFKGSLTKEYDNSMKQDLACKRQSVTHRSQLCVPINARMRG